MDHIIRIIEFAIGISSFAAIFATRERRSRVVFLTLAAAILGVVAYQWNDDRIWRRQVEGAKGAILAEFERGKALTFDDMFANLHYVDYDPAEAALEELLDSRKLQQRLITISDAAGTKFQVRVYELPPVITQAIDSTSALVGRRLVR